MSNAEFVYYMKQALYLIFWLSLPPIAVASVVGTLFSLFQALTQIQESTLTFVPKIVAVMVTIGITAPFVGSQISIFTNLVFSRIESGF